jgi:hypothetical protein
LARWWAEKKVFSRHSSQNIPENAQFFGDAELF